MPTEINFDALSPLEEFGGFHASVPTLSEQAVLRRKLANRLLREAEALEKIISGVTALTRGIDQSAEMAQIEAEVEAAHDPNADSAPVESEESPRGVDAVRAVMREGGVWNAAHVFTALRKRGWIDPDVQHPRKAVETAVNRLYSKYGEIERVGRGHYRYKASRADQPSLNGNGSAEP